MKPRDAHRVVGVVHRVTELLSRTVYNTRVGSGVDSKNSNKQQATSNNKQAGGAKGGQLYLSGS